MAERTAHLIDRVLPDVPVRQWVLSLPYRVRYQLAWDHDACRAIVGVFVRAVLGSLRARARDGGVADGRGGAVAVIQQGEAPGPAGCHARANGFDLHAGLVVPAGQRERLERVCR